ncbi:M1 family metallopeptidase [Sapientia aquatica]|uniref:Aminopeptidase n=1 Tax=Sapientia aquatica TaxID=1549640 RepID=A0A4R5VUR7_9BURK|nr:M1 family metallopeptidase [Sapientia aquatica]TDK62760.1 M1 family peptidase [Sapientia aquatica]
MRRTFISSTIATVFSLASISFAPAFAAAPEATAAVPHANVTTQLPRTVRPTHYTISVIPDAKAATFSGKVQITVEVVKPTSSITLNAADLVFQRATLNAAGNSVEAAKIDVNNEEQTATFHFAKPISKGSYTLAIDYTGIIGIQANGLFLVDYPTANGQKRAIYTQFENSDARRFIPSWDEPNYKATFDLEVTVPTDQMAVSNMPITKKTDLGNGLSVVNFGTSPKMSTYLLFFGAGDFERATVDADGTEVGVITQRGLVSQAAFPLAESKKILREYNDYFGVRFPLPKLDNIASPGSSQFFGAMENWGAIFTFERDILLDPAVATQGDKETSFIVAAHEMAHQWFGDLVTMQWWDDLWLNEGFASWMENRATNRLHPEWNSELSVVGVHQYAMERDSVASTHPVVQHIETVEQASQAFDEITYGKGESVIHMLENYVGEVGWRDGVRLYMKEHAYTNTTSNDFWKAIEQATGKPIRTIAHDFTLQPGVPMINVVSSSCKAGKTTVALTQSEFKRDASTKKALTWHVPVTAQLIGTNTVATTLVTGGKGSITLEGCGPVVVNAGQAGYYRTVYPQKMFKDDLLANFTKLAPIDQLGLLSDSWSLGLSGQTSMSDVLALTTEAAKSSNPQIMAKVTSIFGGMHRLYNGDPVGQARLDKVAIAALSPMLAQIGWTAKPDELSTATKLRDQLIGTLGEVNDPATIDQARRYFAASVTSPDATPAALRKVVSYVVAINADSATWDQIHTSAQNEKSPLIKDQLYELLASAKDKTLAQRALDLASTDEPGATNSAGMIGSVASRHPDLAFDFTIAHLKQLEKFIDGSSRSRYIPRIAGNSSDAAMIGKLEAYTKANISPKARRDSETAIANIKFNVQVRAKRVPEITAWLDNALAGFSAAK